ncbi:MAG: response regulator [Leptolyngbyaceae cyanobacterium bins.59]|nr:response regulator [Leptolyngbyaceae cyanobacterium bins.59]
MNTRCILVIDDEADIREITRMSLKLTKRWEVLQAASGQEGISIAETKQPDAILLDLMMPHMDGITTFKSLKANPATCHIPVLLLTATIRAATRQQYLEAGITEVLVKPFDPGSLGNQIADSLAWS